MTLWRVLMISLPPPGNAIDSCALLGSGTAIGPLSNSVTVTSDPSCRVTVAASGPVIVTQRTPSTPAPHVASTRPRPSRIAVAPSWPAAFSSPRQAIWIERASGCASCGAAVMNVAATWQRPRSSTR